MFDFDSYKKELMGLYQRLCEDEELVRLQMKAPLGFSATAWGDRFMESEPRILFLGKANNGAHTAQLQNGNCAIDLDELFTGSASILLGNGEWMDEYHDKWDRPNAFGWHPGRSPFFRVLRQVSEMLCARYGWCKENWHRYVAYGNFSKCNVDAAVSPCLRILNGREDLFTEILKVELRYLAPDFIVCFTGSGEGTTRWFSDLFLTRLGAVEAEVFPWCEGNRYCVRVFKWQNRYLLVTEHPQRKPEAVHAKAICRAIENLVSE